MANVQSTNVESNNISRGLDCIDGCRFALVFPIVVAHFARFSTNNLTALKLLTQDRHVTMGAKVGTSVLINLWVLIAYVGGFRKLLGT